MPTLYVLDNPRRRYRRNPVSGWFRGVFYDKPEPMHDWQLERRRDATSGMAHGTGDGTATWRKTGKAIHTLTQRKAEALYEMVKAATPLVKSVAASDALLVLALGAGALWLTRKQ